MSYVHKRKRSNNFLGLLVFVIAAVIFVILSTTVFFNVEHISVTGSSNYTAEDIIAASGIKAGDNLVRASTEKCSKRIESQLVYIEHAKISRSFPNTMVIDVEASVPAANFICEDNTLLISKGGKVLDRIDEPKAGLLNYTGVEPSPELVPGDQFVSADEHKDSAIRKLMEYFETNGTDHISSVDVTDHSELRYVYDNRITVKLGSISDIDYKMNFSKEIIRTKIGEKTEGVLTILSDSAAGASFLDKESLENNARIYNENIAARGETEDSDSTDSTSDSSGSVAQQME